MSGKLLKVCAAVMLIAGAGEVLCQGERTSMELDSNPNPKKRRIEIDGWEDSVSTSVIGEIQAIVKVKSGEDEKELRLFGIDGTVTDEEERTFTFQVLSIGTGGTVKVIGGPGMTYSGQDGKWNIFAEKAGSNHFVEVALEMYNGNGYRVELDGNNSVPVGAEGEFRKEESWKLILKPFPLGPDSIKGKYVGSLKVEVSSNG